MPVAVSPRSVEAKLAKYRTNATEREALERRVDSYAREQLAAQSSGATRLRASRSGASSASRTPSSPSHSALPSSPSSPTLGTHKTWSALDTTFEVAGDDPVGTFKETFGGTKQISGVRMLRRIHPTKMETVVQQPPLKFGFESEGARRREYAARATPALLGPKETPLGSTYHDRDSESTAPLLHSPLPRTLRPTQRLDRGIHASALQPHSMSHWQPMTRDAAWDPLSLETGPVGKPDPGPSQQNVSVSAARAQQRASARAAGSPRVPKLSGRAMKQLCDIASPLGDGRHLQKLVAGQPGARVVSELVDLDKLALKPQAMAVERSVLSSSRRVRG